jgi:DNA-binding transcriptional ArsR family regulator
MPEPPTLSLATVQSTLGSAARWAILRELADGSSLMVSELAERTGMTSSAMSKQLNALVTDGIVIHPRGRLYEIAPQFIADKAERTLDFGYCLVRMNAGMEQQ